MDRSGERGCTGMVTLMLNDSHSMAEGQAFKAHSSPVGHHFQTTTKKSPSVITVHHNMYIEWFM